MNREKTNTKQKAIKMCYKQSDNKLNGEGKSSLKAKLLFFDKNTKENIKKLACKKSSKTQFRKARTPLPRNVDSCFS